MIALNIHCPDGPLQFRTACCRQDELPRAGFTQALGIQKPNEKQHRISRSCADRRGDRIGSKAAEAELDPRCTSITDRSRKSHSPEPGAWPLARGGPGDQTFPSSMMRATCDSLSVIPILKCSATGVPKRTGSDENQTSCDNRHQISDQNGDGSI